MDTSDLKDNAKKYLMNTYGDREICLVKGKGSRVWDSNGREYLDFLSGISVNNLGHCPPSVVKAIKEQCELLIHCSNLYLIKPQIELAKKLVENSFADKCFFSNSGTEANEGAIKLARLYSRNKYGTNRYEIISMKQSFHGRTLGAVSATGQKKIQDGFEPLLEGFSFAEFNHIDTVHQLVNEKTCAVIVEPIQGEGGVIPATPNFLQKLRDLCIEKDLVLIFDEIQCGLGRTGTNFAYEYYRVVPDVLTLAKSLGGGVPIGALLAQKPFSDVLSPGKHAHTFGGNPLTCAAAFAFLSEFLDKNISGHAAEMGEYLMTGLKTLSEKYRFIKEIRGVGLMIGIVLDRPGKEINKRCMEKGLLANCTCEYIIRILPPLTVSREDCDSALHIIDNVFSMEC